MSVGRIEAFPEFNVDCDVLVVFVSGPESCDSDFRFPMLLCIRSRLRLVKGRNSRQGGFENVFSVAVR